MELELITKKIEQIAEIVSRWDTTLHQEYLSTDELAIFLGVPKKTLIRWRETGRIAGAVRLGKLWRFRKNDVEKQLKSGVLFR